MVLGSSLKIVSEYDQEIPQSQTADNLFDKLYKFMYSTGGHQGTSATLHQLKFVQAPHLGLVAFVSTPRNMCTNLDTLPWLNALYKIRQNICKNSPCQVILCLYYSYF